MADAVVHKIENLGKLEALLGTTIFALIGLLAQKIYEGGEIPMEIFLGIIILIVFIVVLQLLYYLKFMVEKWAYFKEQEMLTTMKTEEVVAECRKLDRMIELKKLEAVAV